MKEFLFYTDNERITNIYIKDYEFGTLFSI